MILDDAADERLIPANPVRRRRRRGRRRDHAPSHASESGPCPTKWCASPSKPLVWAAPPPAYSSSPRPGPDAMGRNRRTPTRPRRPRPRHDHHRPRHRRAPRIRTPAMAGTAEDTRLGSHHHPPAVPGHTARVDLPRTTAQPQNLAHRRQHPRNRPSPTPRPPPHQPPRRGIQPRRPRNQNPFASTTGTTPEASHSRQTITQRTTLHNNRPGRNLEVNAIDCGRAISDSQPKSAPELLHFGALSD
jgi:hypothetical protein